MWLTDSLSSSVVVNVSLYISLIFYWLFLLQINITTLENFLLRIEQGYSKYKNPYHNLTHAADVTQTTHHIISHCGLMVRYNTTHLTKSHIISHRGLIVHYDTTCLTKSHKPYTSSHTAVSYPYHNLTHAADVTQTTHHIISHCGLMVRYNTTHLTKSHIISHRGLIVHYDTTRLTKSHKPYTSSHTAVSLCIVILHA